MWLDGEWVALIDLEEENTEVRKQRLTSPFAIVPSEGYVSKGNYIMLLMGEITGTTVGFPTD